MFFYLLKNSTIIDTNLSEKERNIKILIYGSICYIVLHATLFIGGDGALLYSLKPYFWLFLILDLGINYMNQHPEIPRTAEGIKDSFKQINSVFDSFLKKKDIDGNHRILNKNMNTNNSEKYMTNNKSQPLGGILSNSNSNSNSSFNKKKVRFQNLTNLVPDPYSSSDSDIGTDIDLDSFKESLNF